MAIAPTGSPADPKMTEAVPITSSSKVRSDRANPLERVTSKCFSSSLRVVGVASVLPCIDDVKVLASVGEDRISLTPETPTVGEVAPELGMSLWNGLFVHKDTPADVREKIIEVAKATVMSERAQKLASETGALVYWQDAEETTARIAEDTATLNAIDESLQ